MKTRRVGFGRLSIVLLFCAAAVATVDALGNGRPTYWHHGGDQRCSKDRCEEQDQAKGGFCNRTSVGNVVFVILSQPNKYHAKLAFECKDDIVRQAKTLGKTVPKIYLSHEDFPHEGTWTIIPLIPRLASLHGANCSFVFLMEDTTRLSLDALLQVLEDHDERDTFVGSALHDNEPTIIHHFAFYEDPSSFKYPNIASGVAIRMSLLKRLAARLRKDTSKMDFSIDRSHELALFIWDEGNGVELTHDDRFCVNRSDNCATYSKTFEACGKPVPRQSIYFAVKTCKKFHLDRVPVVKNTWAKHTSIVRYFSDSKDYDIPTITLGVDNTEHGHCEKTFAIIRYVAREIKNMPEIAWIFIADDDTILSVSGLQELLSCYDASEELALGERYGYGVLGPKGYNYITGGGGIVISRPLLKMLSDPANCDCPSASWPDDMYLGFCLKELGVDVTHSPLFHQARPADYASGYLDSHKAVSFHKHWMVDPMKVYNTWFKEADSKSGIVFYTEL